MDVEMKLSYGCFMNLSTGESKIPILLADISNGGGHKPEPELAGLVAPDAVGQIPTNARRLEVRELVQDGEGVRGAALQVRVFDAAKDDTLVCG